MKHQETISSLPLQQSCKIWVCVWEWFHRNLKEIPSCLLGTTWQSYSWDDKSVTHRDRKMRCLSCKQGKVLFCFIFVFWNRIPLCSPGCHGTGFVAQAGPEVTEIHLPLPPECWDERCAPPLPANLVVFFKILRQGVRRGIQNYRVRYIISS